MTTAQTPPPDLESLTANCAELSPFTHEGSPSQAALAEMLAAEREALVHARTQHGPASDAAIAHEKILRLLTQQVQGREARPVGADTPLDLAEKLADVFQFDVPQSHRKRLGGVVTGSKKLLMRSLRTFHVEVLRPQAEFNRALVEVLRQVIHGGPPGSRDWVRSRLEGLANPMAWKVRSHRPGVSGRVVDLGKKSWLGVSAPLLSGALQGQRQWNENLIRLLELWGRGDVPAASVAQQLAHLEASSDPLASLKVSAVGRANALAWQELFRRQVQFNRHVLSLFRGGAAPAVPGAPPVYAAWVQEREEARLATLRPQLAALGASPLFTIILHPHDRPDAELLASLESVEAQLYGRWQLVVALPRSRQLEAGPFASRVEALDRRARVIQVSETAAEGLDGDWVTVLDAGDRLAPHALAEVAVLLDRDPQPDLVYGDEDRLRGGARADPFCKPDFQEALLTACDFTGRALFVRAASLGAAAWRALDAAPAARYALALQAAEQAAPVAHVPEVLYTLRTGAEHRATDFVPAGGAALLAAHLKTRGRKARVTSARDGFRVRYPLDHEPLVSIIVPFKDKPALLEQLLVSLKQTRYQAYELLLISNNSTDPATFALLDRVTDPRVRKLKWDHPFRYPAINNFGARKARGELLLFLNNDIEVTDPEWLGTLVSELSQPGVGAVGPKLLFPDGKIQHAGVVVGLGGFANHVFAGQPDDGAWTPFGIAGWRRNYLALTSACLLMRREVFKRLQGYDERFMVCGSDVDLCLRTTQLGLSVVYTPATSLVHHESATRRADAIPANDYWESFRAYRPWLGADPCFSPRLSLGPTSPALMRRDEPSAIETALQVLTAQSETDGGSRLSGGRLTYAHQAQAMAQMFDVRGDQPPAARALGAAPKSVTWFVPYFNHPFGGVHTILRFADLWKHRFGVSSRFVIYDNPNVTAREMQARVALLYPEPPGPFQVLKSTADVENLPATDVAIATLWTSAYFALRHPAAKTRAYFVQDYEPLFYPAGTVSALAENTYRMGFFGIFNSPGLRDWVTAQHPMEGVAFEPSVDHDLFHPEGRVASGKPIRVFFYGRPSVDRNAFELGLEALRLLKQRLGTRVQILSAGEAWNPSWFSMGEVIENLGVLPYRQTADLYRSIDVGLCFMFTKHPSYLPLEMMACGVTVVTNDNPANAWLLQHQQNCLLAQPTISAVAAQLEEAAKHPALRSRVGQAAAHRLANGNWDDAAARAYEGLRDHCLQRPVPRAVARAPGPRVSGSRRAE